MQTCPNTMLDPPGTLKISNLNMDSAFFVEMIVSPEMNSMCAKPTRKGDFISAYSNEITSMPISYSLFLSY